MYTCVIRFELQTKYHWSLLLNTKLILNNLNYGNTMAIKRIIMDIDESLHKKLKDYSIRDDRTLNSAIKRVLAAGIDIVDNNHLVSNNSTKDAGDTNVVLNSIDPYSGRIIDKDTVDFETHKYGKVLIPYERKYLNENPGKTLDDYNDIFKPWLTSQWEETIKTKVNNMTFKIIKVPVDEELSKKIKDITYKERRSTAIVIYKLLKLGVDQHLFNEGKSRKPLFTS